MPTDGESYDNVDKATDWKVKFTITGICDDGEAFKVKKEAPVDAVPKIIDGMLYFEIQAIPVGRDIAIETQVVTPCLPSLTGCCVDETDKVSLTYYGGSVFNSVVSGDKINHLIGEFPGGCGCKI
jgi:hypothetical protein